MDKKQQIKQYCRQFKITGIRKQAEELIAAAEKKSTGFLDFTVTMLKAEADHRHDNELQRRIKTATLPVGSDLNAYDHTVENGLSKTRLNQLRELTWLDQIYNIMLMGPSGTGKTFLAAGRCADALKKGYKAYFRTMEELMTMLKLKDVTKTHMTEYKRHYYQ
jgi:DNA replication protein DnaC